jgi:hypothetical protein
MPSARQTLLALVVGAIALGLVVRLVLDARGQPIPLGFRFAAVTYGEREAMVVRLGGPLVPAEIAFIERLARAEIETAFTGLPVLLRTDGEGLYRVEVVQQLRNARAPNYPGPAGESRSVPGLGGRGAVNFRAMVSAAVAHAPEGTERPGLLAAIGRGIGRTAVHEFTHQLLASAPVDAATDRSSYEFPTVDRPEHFYGAVRWAHARPLLERRLRVAGGR